MGVIEKEIRKRERVGKTQKIILGAIAVAGIMTVAILAPNVLQAFGMVSKAIGRSKKYEIRSSLSRLAKRGLIEFGKNKKGNTVVKLTPKGEKILRITGINGYKVKKPKKWDGKWRVITFDIREQRKSTRDKIRRTLQTIGFYQLHKSVWVYPYDCEDLIMLLKADFKIGKDLLYLVAWKIEYEKPLLDHFKLKR
jgi:DNA-binding transcriptional regulator PaaX